MHWFILIKAAAMGVVEGITEFLPISSTGHLIIAAKWLHFNHATAEVFEVVIQLGAILAVCWEYRQRLFFVAQHILNHKTNQRFLLNIFIAFIPASLLGALFISFIKTYLFNPFFVACMLTIGGVIILWIERCCYVIKIHSMDDIKPIDALKIGLIQIFSLMPGISRSGSTIMGGLLCGLNRQVATEFSFFLAIPVMFAATFYDGIRSYALFNIEDIPVFAIGLIVAFFSAFIAVKGFLRFISQHTFYLFAWYRIIFGIILFAWYYQ